MSTSKTFSTRALLSVTTGFALVNFGEIHEVFDHFYPGIMQLGILAMAEKGKERVLEQHPTLEDDFNAAAVQIQGIDDREVRLGMLMQVCEKTEQRLGTQLNLDTDPNRMTPSQNGL